MSDHNVAATGSEWLFEGNARRPYDKYLRTDVLKPLRYAFVREHYDQPLEALAAGLGPRTQERLGTAFSCFHDAGLTTLFGLIDRVSTQADAETLMAETGLSREQVEGVVDHIKHVVLPNPAQVRQCIRDDETEAINDFLVLKQHKLANGFALLDRGCTPELRAELGDETGLAPNALLDLVHRVDVTRMPWMGGRMVKMLWWVGIRSLQNLREVEPHRLFEGLNDYYAEQGTTRPYDYTDHAMAGMVASARRIPTVVVG